MGSKETDNDAIRANDSNAETLTPTVDNQSAINNEPPKNKKWKKILIIVSLIIIAIPLLGYLLLFIGFSGGIDGVISDLKSTPDPKSASVTEKRNLAKKDIGTEFDQLETSFTPTQAEDSIYDNCYEGQNNWKVKEGYAHRCDYRVTRYYGFNGDFRQKMLDLEQELFKLKWQTSNGTGDQLSHYIKNYYDKYYGNKDPSISASFGGTYLVSSLPTVINGYSKNGIGMDIAYGEKDSKDIYWLESAPGFSKRGFPFFEDKNFIDVKSVFAEITKNNRYVLAISLEKNYFEN